jgi:Mrp family chromosome partitioning ATPase
MGLKWLIATEDHDMSAPSKLERQRQVDEGLNLRDAELIPPFEQRMDDGTLCVLIPDLTKRKSHKTTNLGAGEKANAEKDSFRHLEATLSEISQAMPTSSATSSAIPIDGDGFSFLPLAMPLKAPVISLGGEPTGDLTESPNEWRERRGGETPQRKQADEPVKKTSKEQAVEKIARSIVERYPVGNPGLVVFAGLEANSMIDETCARVATSLSERKIGRALLIDADTRGQALTIASGVAGQAGVTDIVAGEIEWKNAVFGGPATGLDFIGAGSGQELGQHSTPLLRQLVVGLKSEYQFICVSVGDSGQISSQFWNDVGDGTYLLVSLKNSNQSRAKAAVSELRLSGGRLLGCVVTDVD